MSLEFSTLQELATGCDVFMIRELVTRQLKYSAVCYHVACYIYFICTAVFSNYQKIEIYIFSIKYLVSYFFTKAV